VGLRAGLDTVKREAPSLRPKSGDKHKFREFSLCGFLINYHKIAADGDTDIINNAGANERNAMVEILMLSWCKTINFHFLLSFATVITTLVQTDYGAHQASYPLDDSRQ